MHINEVSTLRQQEVDKTFTHEKSVARLRNLLPEDEHVQLLRTYGGRLANCLTAANPLYRLTTNASTQHQCFDIKSECDCAARKPDPTLSYTHRSCLFQLTDPTGHRISNTHLRSSGFIGFRSGGFTLMPTSSCNTYVFRPCESNQ